jgi:hypothetical protein
MAATHLESIKSKLAQGQSLLELFSEAILNISQLSTDSSHLGEAESNVQTLEVCTDLVARQIFNQDRSYKSFFDAFEEIRTEDIPLFTIEFVLAETYTRSCSYSVPKFDPKFRHYQVVRLLGWYQIFLERCEQYEVLSTLDQEFLKVSVDPAELHFLKMEVEKERIGSGDVRRALKIKRYRETRRLESELMSKYSSFIASLQKSTPGNQILGISLSFIQSLLKTTGISLDDQTVHLKADKHGQKEGIEEWEDEESLLRDVFMCLVQYLCFRTVDEFASLKEEEKHLKRMLEESILNESRSANELDDSAKLDMSDLGRGLPTTGPLLGKGGKPLRPFTLLSTRNEMAARVFQPGHRLPTMTIDEYIDAEISRGGILPKYVILFALLSLMNYKEN